MPSTPDWRVLVVEDDRAIRKLLYRQLTTLGLGVDLARDGREAYQLWADNAYDLVLTDCSMPEMNGFELAAEIRGAGETDANRVPIVGMSGYAGDEQNRPPSEMNDFIGKPISAEELRRVLRRWLPSCISADEHDQPLDGPARKPAPPGSPLTIEDTDIRCSIVKTFIDTLPAYIMALDRGCSASSRSEVAAAAHKLKSAAQLVGGTEVAELCDFMERSAHRAEFEEINQVSRRIRETVQVLANSLAGNDSNRFGRP